MGIPKHHTCLLWNLYASQEPTVQTGHGTMDWFQIGKGVHQGHILSPCWFNSDAEHIMWNAGLDEAQAGIKIARKSINNLRYVDDTILMAESKEELKSLLVKVKEEKNWRQDKKGMTEDEMAGCHHQLDGYEFECTPGVGDGQGGLACCVSWGRKESDTTERLNWTEKEELIICYFLPLLLTPLSV